MSGSLNDIIKAHALKYPKMRPCDAVKLVYQNEFGNGHMVTDEESCLKMLVSEHRALEPQNTAGLFEDIGNNYCRLNLAALDTHTVSLGTVNKIFVKSGGRNGGAAAFNNKLLTLGHLTQEGVFSFDKPQLSAYLNSFSYKDGAPGHSAEYRAAYRPAYRVVDAAYAQLFSVIEAIEKLPKTRINTIAIEGASASGKSTAARLLGGLYGAAVIHTDDFFLPRAARGTDKWKQPGGNIDYSRFNRQISSKIARAGNLSYYRYDCQTDCAGAQISVVVSDIVIVEGAYSTHPDIQIDYDLKVFFEIDPVLQKERLVVREGGIGAKPYFEQWVPRETAYFDKFRVRQNCGVCVYNFGA